MALFSLIVLAIAMLLSLIPLCVILVLSPLLAIYIIFIVLLPYLFFEGVLLPYLRRVPIPIKNRHVFISGGSSGIGLALAKSAVLDGARVSILASDLVPLEEAKESIKVATGFDVSIYCADMRDKSAVKEAIDKSGDVDVLICTQHGVAPFELENLEVALMDSMIDVNVTGTISLINIAVPGMKRRTGETRQPASITFICSEATQTYAAHSTIAFAWKGIAESLQQEVKSKNIHVSMIFSHDTDTNVEEEARKALKGLKNGKFTMPKLYLPREMRRTIGINW